MTITEVGQAPDGKRSTDPGIILIPMVISIPAIGGLRKVALGIIFPKQMMRISGKWSHQVSGNLAPFSQMEPSTV